ncbi:uncharacterized protein LOC114424107 [Glycine soja]|uniref:uncharacterized protein LOC114424107 n=1 Tax=Glycine soja TaxID=3848 RepID=UPI00103D3456|nr:uncharacterized protein LOC114424107 [Glycine soja]
MTETSMRAGNADVYGFLEPQSIQRFGQSQFESESYIKNWMHNSKRDVYLGAYLNGAHWQMVVILPKENVVIWFCSLHNRPDNFFKGIINSALKGLNDTPQSKSKAATWMDLCASKFLEMHSCGFSFAWFGDMNPHVLIIWPSGVVVYRAFVEGSSLFSNDAKRELL